MKRRYKQGDWFRVPLGGPSDALGLVTQADRSRLYGFFFAVHTDAVTTHEALRALHADAAVLAAHFGGSGLEEARWPLVATSLRFEESRWPKPGARSPRYASPSQLEAMLRAAIAGEAPWEPLAVYEVRSPLDVARLETLDRSGRVQFSEPLAIADVDLLAHFLERRDDVQLRVHGPWNGGFDLRSLMRFHAVQSLALDCRELCHADALASLGRLRALRIAAQSHPLPLRVLCDLPVLSGLQLAGTNAEIEILQDLPLLETLKLAGVRSFAPAAMACAKRIRILRLSHGRYDLSGLAQLPELEELELRDMHLERLPDLSSNRRLRTVVLRDVRGVRDLQALVEPPALSELVIEGMYQLEVPDFQPLAAAERIPLVTLDIGSKTKSREVYKMLQAGKTR